MTDTNLGTIWVTGQRRAPGGSFPAMGGPDDEWDVHQNQDEPYPTEPEAPFNPCAAPETALEWNADAAAATAAKEFARLASERVPPEALNAREWGCYLYLAADGSVQLGPITYGEPFSAGGVGSVELSESGIDPASIIGSVHSHSDGNHLPSSGNQNAPGDIQHLESMIAYSGNPSAKLYIVSRNQGPAGFSPYNQVNVYDKSSAQKAVADSTAGPEVNPGAMPCPSP